VIYYNSFKNPINAITNEELYPADISVNSVTTSGNAIYIGLKIDEDSKIILDCRWKYLGDVECRDALTHLSELVIGRRFSDLKNLKEQEVFSYIEKPSDLVKSFVTECVEIFKQLKEKNHGSSE
jgi:hypothetical protein